MSSSDAVQTAKAVAAKKNIVIDPEVVRKRRAEKAAQRASAEAAAVTNKDSVTADAASPAHMGFMPRPMVDVTQSEAGPSNVRIKLMTWNLLAQCLVRRELFPGSDLMKFKDRAPVIEKEFLHYAPDIACLQEVDKIEHHGPIFQKAGYAYKYTTVYDSKKHGLCILWKKSAFEYIGERIVRLDDAEIGRRGRTESKRTACSRVTRNAGLLVALKSTAGHSGVILCTHHLFWHARHVYERARQCAILLTEISNFREVNPEWQSYPCFFTGDFNIQPSEATYRLLTGVALSPEMIDELRYSTVVHSSLDKYLAKQAALAACENVASQPNEDDGTDVESNDKDDQQSSVVYAQPEGDEDRVLKNTRPAKPEDGLLTLEELQEVYRPWNGRLTSAYGSYGWRMLNERGNYFGERNEQVEAETEYAPTNENAPDIAKVREGYYEPAYTNITPLWRCTLDYIFIVASPSADKVTVRKEPSDHMPMMVEVEW
ncbi:RNA exonuclease ngl2 [Cystobasidiomycetes sp. EMM_F5]